MPPPGWWGTRLEGQRVRAARGRSLTLPPPLTAQSPHARARIAVDDEGKNATERGYGEHLELQKLAGEIRDYRWAPFSLRLAPRTWYRVDYLVIARDGVLEVHEVKGHWEDDARVKIKAAAVLFPWFLFRGVQRRGSKRHPTWEVEEIRSA